MSQMQATGPGLKPPEPSTTTPLPIGTSIAAGSLRAEMEARRAAGRRFDLREAIGIVVPLCTQLARMHASGKRFFVHPSDILYSTERGAEVVEDRAHTPPTLPRDHACLAPEERKGAEGDARSSVFTIGAILYEMLTNHSVGPAMRRPTEAVPGLPRELDMILGKALVGDPHHRPADVAALAQALHHLSPNASEAPPPADESHLDHDLDFDVDVSMSMLPPPSAPHPRGPDGPFPQVVEVIPASRARADPTQRLADLKAALEADPRARYVVVKDGMDHGPFTAVELLQQIATHSFTGDNTLRDAFSGDERLIKDWEEFAPFAEQSKLNRDIVEEKKAFEAVVVQEKQHQWVKVYVGAFAVALIAAVLAGFWYRDRQSRERRLRIETDRALSVDVDGGLGPGTATARPVAGGGGMARAAPGGGNYPVLAGGMSCEAAQDRYVTEYKMGGNEGPPDLTAGAYGAVLNRGSYLNSCGVPSNMEVNICAAVQNGRAVGVTISTRPPNPGIASCIAGAVRSLPFPSHPRLDVARTTFAAN